MSNYPKVLGGALDSTVFTAMDINFKQNIIIGGSSNDTGLVNTKSTPIVAYYDSSSGLKWAK